MARARDVLLAAIALSSWAAPPAPAAEPGLVGWIEHVRVGPTQALVEAKLDTGADVSSLGVDSIKLERRGSARWVVYTFRDSAGERVRLESRITRFARITTHGGTRRRPVIMLPVCLGSAFAEVETNLEDRAGFNYPMLVGRNFLLGRFAVDPARKHSVQPACAAEKGRG